MKKDESFNRMVSRSLKLGSIVSGFFMVLGIALFVFGFKASLIIEVNFMMILQGLIGLQPTMFVLFSILILVATFFILILISAYSYIKEKDWFYIVICILIIAILSLSFVFA